MFFVHGRVLLNVLRLAGIVVLFIQPALAQTDSTKNAFLQEVVVQSTRTSAKSPVPHTNLNADFVARHSHAQDVPYLLSGIPSAVETSDGGTGIGYTGLRIRGSDPTRTNVTINGIPLNDAESQGVYWVDLPDLAASASEIQVQRGVGSSTNGAGAFGATLNLDLSKPENDPFAILSNTIGSFGTHKHSLQLGTGQLKHGLSFQGRVSGVYSDGYIDRASARLQSVHLTGTYAGEQQSFQVHFLTGNEITYQAWDGLPAQFLGVDSLRTYNVAGTERPGSPYPDQVDNYTQRHFLAHYKRMLSPRLMLQLNGHYTKGFGYYEQYKADQDIHNYGLLPDSSVTSMDLVRQLWLNNDFYGGTFALRWMPDQVWKPTYMLGGALSRYEGLHYGEIIWTEAYSGTSTDYRYYENKADKRDANVFLKTEITPLSNFTAFVDLQLRGIHYNFLGFDRERRQLQQDVNLLFWNPKLGATYSLSNTFSLYAFAGIAHREPNRDDYTQSTPQSRPKSEKLLDCETGLRGKSDRWSFSANFFWMRYRDQLVLDGRINDVGAYIRTNVPDSWRSGLELEASTFLGPMVRLSANAVLSQNRVRNFVEYRDNWDTGEQDKIEYNNTTLAFSPGLTAWGEATVNLLQSRKPKQDCNLAISLTGKYVGKQFLDNTSNENTALPGYFTSDARINLDLPGFLGQETSLILSLNNVLNRHYVSNGWVYRYTSAGYDPRPDDSYTLQESGSVYHQAGYFPQAGRNWMATLRIRF